MSHLVPFGTLFRYFAARYVGWVGLCLVGLAMIISLIQTVELVRSVSVRSVDSDEISYIKLAFLNLPSVIEMILPIGVLSGSMLCFAAWNRSNEFVVVRGFGQSIWTALSPALFSAFVIGMLYVTIINPIASVTSQEYSKQMATIFGKKDSNFTVSTTGIWLRDTLDQGKLIIHGEALNVETASIINPIIYLYGNDVHVKAVYSAGLMQLTDSGWVLDHAFRWQNDGQETDLGSIMLPTRLGALDLRQSGLAPQSISIYSLPGFIGSLEKAGIPTTNYLYYLYKTLSVPFLMIGIAMLAARFSLRHLSRGRSMWLFSRGALIAIALLIFSYFMQIMGTSLQLPVRLAALAPAISILLIGAIALARTDES